MTTEQESIPPADTFSKLENEDKKKQKKKSTVKVSKEDSQKALDEFSKSLFGKNLHVPTAAQKDVMNLLEGIRADSLAYNREREAYYKKIAEDPQHIRLFQDTSDIDDRYSEPKYDQVIELEFHDVPMHKWKQYLKDKTEVEDIGRQMRTGLQAYVDAKLAAPRDYNILSQKRVDKELELYQYGFWLFLRGTSEQFNRGNYRQVRDLVDAMEYLVNNSLPKLTQVSDSSSSPMIQ